MRLFLYLVIYLCSLLPFPVLYFFSDVLYLVLYRVKKYRLNVLRQNLQQAFPDASPAELRDLEKTFYRHLCDVGMEVLKMYSMSPETLIKRVEIARSYAYDELQESNQPSIVLTAHWGNWEWGVGRLHLAINRPMLAAYKVQGTELGEYLLKKMRRRSRIQLVPMKKVLLRLRRQLHHNPLAVFLADQTSTRGEAGTWEPFFGRTTPFFTGPARLAAKMQLPVYLLYVYRESRGRYKIDVERLTANAAEIGAEHLQQLYIRKLEEGIRQQPPFWLWSHRRWKHVKPKGSVE